MYRTALTALTAALATGLCACSSSAGQPDAPSHEPGQSTRALGRPAPGGGRPSSPSTRPKPPTVPDACALLTRAEAERVLKKKLQAGDDTRAGAADGVASCNYDAPVTGPSGSLGVFVQMGTPDALKTDRNLGHRFRRVAGLGDEAFEEPDNGSIFVRRGPLWVFINGPISTPRSALESAARIASARLA